VVIYQEIAIQLISPVLIGLLSLSLKNIKDSIKDLRDVTITIRESVNDLKNGCFARHEKIARELGQNEMRIVAYHERLDKLEDDHGQ
jgi:hypothetical protein